MKVREVFGSILPKLIGTSAITLYPFVFYAEDPPDEVTRRHEWEHVFQVRRIGWFRFYWLYLKEYLTFRLIGKCDHNTAYYSISFEMEAYGAEKDGKRPWEQV